MTIARIYSGAGEHYNLSVGASAVEPYRLVYLATGVVQHARGNAAATARGIAGVTQGAAVSGALALVQRTERTRVSVDAATPSSGLLFQPAYLSSAEGGLATSVITGLTYPRLLGWFSEDAVASDGTAQLALDLNELRDDATEWLLERYAPTVSASTKDFAVDMAHFRDLRIVGAGCTGIIYDWRVDGAAASSLFWGVDYSGASSGTDTLRAWGGDAFEMNFSRSVNSLVGTTRIAQGAAGQLRMAMNALPTASIGVIARDTFTNPMNGFVANQSVVKLFGRVR